MKLKVKQLKKKLIQLLWNYKQYISTKFHTYINKATVMSNNQHYTLIDNKFIIGNFENEKYDDFFLEVEIFKQ